MTSPKDIDEAYEKLRAIGKNTVENLVQWLKDAQILQMVEKTEKEAVAMFRDVKEQEKVSKKEFDDVVATLFNDVDVLKLVDNLNKMAASMLNTLASAATEFSKATENPKSVSKDKKPKKNSKLL